MNRTRSFPTASLANDLIGVVDQALSDMVVANGLAKAGGEKIATALKLS